MSNQLYMYMKEPANGIQDPPPVPPVRADDDEEEVKKWLRENEIQYDEDEFVKKISSPRRGLRYSRVRKESKDVFLTWTKLTFLRLWMPWKVSC